MPRIGVGRVALCWCLVSLLPQVSCLFTPPQPSAAPASSRAAASPVDGVVVVAERLTSQQQSRDAPQPDSQLPSVSGHRYSEASKETGLSAREVKDTAELNPNVQSVFRKRAGKWAGAAQGDRNGPELRAPALRRHWGGHGSEGGAAGESAAHTPSFAAFTPQQTIRLPAFQSTTKLPDPDNRRLHQRIPAANTPVLQANVDSVGLTGHPAARADEPEFASEPNYVFEIGGGADNGKTSLRRDITSGDEQNQQLDITMPQSNYSLVIEGNQNSILAFDKDPTGLMVLELGGNFTPPISSVLHSCWYGSYEPTLQTEHQALPEVYELEDPEEEVGCQSCELDDDGEPMSEDDEGLGLRPPLPIIQEGAAENQLFLEGLDAYVSRSELQKILQSGLLNTDTFSAEDRRRRPLSDEVATCKCQVNADETVCTLDSGFCDSLPVSDVPSGILEVSGTNISYLGVESLLPYHSVSVMKLGDNQLERIDPGTFANMTHLHNLSLIYNRLTALDEMVFEGATNLLELLVSYNRFKNLTQVTRSLSLQTTPRLVHLSVGGNRFSNVTREDFAPMKGIHLRDLQLHENKIRHIAKDTFADLRSLKRLRLRHNRLNLWELRDLLRYMQNSTLEMIDLSGLGAYSILDLHEVLYAVSTAGITGLQLNNYCFYSLMRLSIPALPKLKVLTMSDCGLHTIHDGTFEGFTSLEELDLSNNYFTYIPSAVVLHQLRSLDLSRANFLPDVPFKVHEYRFRTMNSLRYLDLSKNNVQMLDRGAFVGLENLTVLVMDAVELHFVEEFTFSSLENLSELYLSNNPLGDQDFQFTWPGLTNLTKLLLDNCSISNSLLYLREMPKLQMIKMSNNFLQNITHMTFAELHNLQAVDLSHNLIRPWDYEVFKDTTNLTRIYLDNNQITWVTSAMVEDIRNARVLTLRDNPFLCDCQLYDWLMWEEQNAHPINTSSMTDPTTSDVADCTCQMPPQTEGTKVLDYYSNVNLSPCHNSGTSILIMMIPVFFSGILVAVLARVLWKNRWYLRYWIFKVTSQRWLKRLRGRPADYLYDAFVSYSSEDADFVLELMDHLEKHQPFYRLCVYERDFEIGNVISECILESINTSRKTILVLSDHFAKSHWCRWEMSLVQCRLFEQKRDDLILVKLGKVRSRHLTPTIKYLMRTRIYIEWGPSSQQQMLFWERLRTALQEPRSLPHLPRTV